MEIAARLERWEAVDGLIASPVVRENLIGTNAAWISLVRQIIELATFTDASVLITGETGTGKELIARLVHTFDLRRQKHQLVILDCTTIVPELSGSEFFGHERGAFTGAFAARDGAFALANRGTLFLDEVGDLPLTLQAELLRVIQEHTYKRVGSNTWQETDFRLVCATNRDLLHEESQGRFRRDFFYRIASWTCRLPPLRERTEDILPLACYFLRQLQTGDEKPAFDEGVCDYLLERAYPGNVRELKQLVSRMSYRHVGPGPITVGDIPDGERPQVEREPEERQGRAFERFIRHMVTTGIGLKEISRVAANTAISIALGETGGNVHSAARLLGVTDRALQMRRAASRHANESGCGEPPSQAEGSA
jgi:transcriptional regulator with GAF, ATPase, and Fis domain